MSYKKEQVSHSLMCRAMRLSVMLLLLLPVANASAQHNLPRKAKSKASKYSSLPSGYSQVGSTKLYYGYKKYTKTMNTDNYYNVDIIGFYNNAYYSSTFDDGGYKLSIKVDNNSAARVDSRNGTTVSGVTIQTSIIQLKNYARICYDVSNTNENDVEVSLGCYADVMIGDNDSAPISRRYDNNNQTYGLTMKDGKGAQLCALFGKGISGVTPVDDFWFGHWVTNYEPLQMIGNYSPAENWMQENGSYDSGMGWCWKNRTIEAGTTMTFSFLVAVGEVNLDEPKPYAVYENGTLTFYNDDLYSVRSGVIYDMYDNLSESQKPEWVSQGENVTKVVFDASFAEYAPTSTAYWFCGFANLSQIDGIEYLNTSQSSSMSNMFYGCSSLDSLNVTHFDTSNVTDMTDLFNGCSSLYFLDVTHFDTSNVTDMSGMFSSCSSLNSLDVTHLDTSNVTDMSGMFSRCRSLTSLDVTHFDTSKVIYMGKTKYKNVVCYMDEYGPCTLISTAGSRPGMFSGCASLKELDVTHFETSNVEDMSDMFGSCSSLASLDVSNFNTSLVKNMCGMFSGCKMASLDITNFNTSNVTNMGSMFALCSLLTKIDVTHFDTSNVTDIGGIFAGCSSLTELEVTNFNTSKVTQMRGMFSGCTSLTSLNLTHFDTSNVRDMDYMFQGCFRLMSIELKNFDTARTKGMRSMFDCNYSLTSLDLSNFDTSNVTDMSYMFYKCSSMTILDLSSFNTSSVTDMRTMFRGCSSLTFLDLSSFDTSNVTDMYNMFSGCSSLASLDLSSFNTSNVTDMSDMFEGCSSLTSLNLSSFNTSNVTDMSDMFKGCSSLASLDLSNLNTSNVTSMRNMFNACSSLTKLDLSKFDMSKVVGNWKTDGMMQNCSSLATVILPASVKEIGDDFVYGCLSMKDFYCFAEEVPKTSGGRYAFLYSPIASATLYVPEGSVEAYRTTAPWSGFGTIVGLSQDVIDGIADVKAQSGEWSHGKCYDLQGHEVSDEEWRNGNLLQGIYIKNGRKVFIK